MLEHLIIQIPLHYGHLWGLKPKETFKLLALKVVTVSYERWSLKIGSKYTLVVISLGNFWYFGEQVTEERCSQPEAQLYSIILSVVFGTGKREEKAMEHMIACISHFNNGK